MPTSARPSRSRCAFSMLEVVATVVLIGIAAPALLVAVRDATTRRASVQQQVIARWLACEKLEDITADRHSTTRGWTYITTANYPAETTITSFPGYSRSVAITETSNDLSTAGTGYRKVTVSVTYPDAHQGSKTVTLATVFTDYTQ
ncbi:MAG: type II secretion system protein [Phycisphaerales bacterium]